MFQFLSTQDILIPTPYLLIIGESFQSRKEIFETTYLWQQQLTADFFAILQKEQLVCSVFCKA